MSPKYFCEYCGRSLRDDPFERRRHRESRGHRENVAVWYELTQQGRTAERSLRFPHLTGGQSFTPARTLGLEFAIALPRSYLSAAATGSVAATDIMPDLPPDISAADLPPSLAPPGRPWSSGLALPCDWGWRPPPGPR